MPRNDLIQLRGGTAADWAAANPVLAVREPGVELDTGRMKFGDGEAAWVDLPYVGGGGDGGGGGGGGGGEASIVAPGRWSYVPAAASFGTTGVTNTLYFSPIWLAGATEIDAIAFQKISLNGGSVGRVGVYAPRADGGEPGALLVDSGTFDAGPTGAYIVDVDPTPLPAGLVWLVCVLSAGDFVHAQTSTTWRAATDGLALSPANNRSYSQPHAPANPLPAMANEELPLGVRPLMMAVRSVPA